MPSHLDSSSSFTSARLLLEAQVAVASATPDEERLLRAIDAALGALHGYDREIDAEMTRQYAERVSFSERSDRRIIRAHPPDKSDFQRELEQKRRECKDALSACVHTLAGGRMYSEGTILSCARGDGDYCTRNPAARAIRQSDVEWALGNCPNLYARRAFWMRYRGGYEDEEIARTISSVPGAISRLCNVALRHAHAALNEPVVRAVRAQYFNMILAYGLQFPDYGELRHKGG